jgi:ectoine hydroxylase-related dioxygenase (phytanoyl-CoA dioxygenase family)
MHYKLSQEEKKKYYEEGYLLLRNVIDPQHINELMEFVAHVIELEGRDYIKDNHYSRDDILNKLLIEIKRSNPSSSSWIYQTILSSYKLKKFFIDIDVVPLVCDLLNIENTNNVGVVSPAFRFDIPGDSNNIRTWHQDGNYFLENKKGDSHLVVWIPTNKATKENGSVIVASKSHRNGKLESNHEKSSEEFRSEQYTAPKEQFENYEHVYIEADVGDLAFIHMDLLHSSGINKTQDEVRYTAQIRMNTINDDAYRPVQLSPHYPEYKRSLK